jgi:hypothetical protein
MTCRQNDASAHRGFAGRVYANGEGAIFREMTLEVAAQESAAIEPLNGFEMLDVDSSVNRLLTFLTLVNFRVH